jgi:hypothetical protein
LIGAEFFADVVPPLMEMPATAGVICLRRGASERAPLTCSTIGSGTLALALMIPLKTAKPNVAAPNSCFTISNPFR